MELTKEYFDKKLEGFATKADLKGFATKTDLANFATKADLANFATKTDLANFATKADLANFATKADLADLATKGDLKAQTAELKGYVHESFETQQVYMDERFKELVDGMQILVNFPGLKAKTHKVR